MLRWFTIILSFLGLAMGVYAVSTADTPPVQIPLDRPAAVNPYTHGVAALGLVEPLSREVDLVAPEPGLVTAVAVHVGDLVKPADLIFQLDTRVIDADLLRARAAVKSAEEEIARWHALPRAEDIPPLQAAVSRAQALLKDREDLLKVTQETARRGGGNDREVSSAQFAVEAARAELVRAQADLAKTQAGGWNPDLAIAQAALDQRRAEVSALELLKERLSVRSPQAGTVLRRNLEPGEFAGTDRNNPAIIIGDLSHLAVRAQVDEEDIALVKPGSRAVARTRGAAPIDVPLTLSRIEPYARPKRDLSGDNLERVDTRVIDVVFEVALPADAPLYPGQALDVFIEAAPVH